MSQQDIFFNANGNINNFLDSAKDFLDFLQNNWGKKNLDKNNYKKWNNIRMHKCFDVNLSFRICYYLRNFVEHPGDRNIFSSMKLGCVGKPWVIDLLLNKNNILSCENYAKSFIKKVGKQEDYWRKNKNLYINQYLEKYFAAIYGLFIESMELFIHQNNKKIQFWINYCKKAKIYGVIYTCIISKSKFEETGIINNFARLTTEDDLIECLKSLKKEGIPLIFTIRRN